MKPVNIGDAPMKLKTVLPVIFLAILCVLVPALAQEEAKLTTIMPDPVNGRPRIGPMDAPSGGSSEEYTFGTVYTATRPGFVTTFILAIAVSGNHGVGRYEGWMGPDEATMTRIVADAAITEWVGGNDGCGSFCMPVPYGWVWQVVELPGGTINPLNPEGTGYAAVHWFPLESD